MLTIQTCRELHKVLTPSREGHGGATTTAAEPAVSTDTLDFPVAPGERRRLLELAERVLLQAKDPSEASLATALLSALQPVDDDNRRALFQLLRVLARGESHRQWPERFSLAAQVRPWFQQGPGSLLQALADDLDPTNVGQYVGALIGLKDVSVIEDGVNAIRKHGGKASPALAVWLAGASNKLEKVDTRTRDRLGEFIVELVVTHRPPRHEEILGDVMRAGAPKPVRGGEPLTLSPRVSLLAAEAIFGLRESAMR